jgi:hypothetical protein
MWGTYTLDTESHICQGRQMWGTFGTSERAKDMNRGIEPRRLNR